MFFSYITGDIVYFCVLFLYRILAKSGGNVENRQAFNYDFHYIDFNENRHGHTQIFYIEFHTNRQIRSEDLGINSFMTLGKPWPIVQVFMKFTLTRKLFVKGKKLLFRIL